MINCEIVYKDKLLHTAIQRKYTYFEQKKGDQRNWRRSVGVLICLRKMVNVVCFNGTRASIYLFTSLKEDRVSANNN